MNNAIAVIPARLKSTRLPEKLMSVIDGKTLLEHTYRNSLAAENIDDVYIACDDQILYDTAVSFGAKVFMTSVEHRSGTDRIAEILPYIDADIIINLQADEPMLDPEIIDRLVDVMTTTDAVMATAVVAVTDPDVINDPNNVKVVLDNDNNAQYFSRAPIPFNRDNIKCVKYFKHFGIYAYRKFFLSNFRNLQPSYIEDTEKLEQLRVLSAGYKIKTIECSSDSIGIDTQENLQAFKELYAKK